MRLARTATAILFLTGTLSCLTSAAAPDPHAISGVWWSKTATPRLLPMDRSPLPFTPEGKARYEKTVAGLNDGSIVDEAVHLCLPEGMPRALTSGYPFQVMSTPGQLTFAYEANPFFRTVRLSDKHADPEDWDPAYMGEAIAEWKGNTLVIDSTNFNAARIYLDSTGLPASDKLHLIEHIDINNGGKSMTDLVTIDDPVNFSKPWTARLSFERRPDIRIKMDSVCGEPRRDLVALRKQKPGPAVSLAPIKGAPVVLTPAQLAINGFWRGPEYGPPPGSTAARTGGAVPGTGPMAGAAKLMQPWAAEEFAKKVALEKSGHFVPTPTNTCIPAVVPGIGVPLQQQILIEPHQVTFLYELNRTTRIVRIGQEHPADLKPSWLGDSVGHWEGDTLVIDTIGFNDKNMVANGVPFSSKMHIVQRMRMVGDKLEEITTFDDPGAWTSVFTRTTQYRPGYAFQEFVCAENNQQGGVATSTGVPTPYSLGAKTPASQGTPLGEKKE